MLGSMVVNIYHMSSSLKMKMKGGDHTITTVHSPTIPINGGARSVNDHDHSANEESFHELPTIEQAYFPSHRPDNLKD